MSIDRKTPSNVSVITGSLKSIEPAAKAPALPALEKPKEGKIIYRIFGFVQEEYTMNSVFSWKMNSI